MDKNQMLQERLDWLLSGVFDRGSARKLWILLGWDVAQADHRHYRRVIPAQLGAKAAKIDEAQLAWLREGIVKYRSGRARPDR